MPTPTFSPARLAVRLLALTAAASAGLAFVTSRIDPESLASISSGIDASTGYASTSFSVIAAATLVSEDLTCIAAGMLVGQGHLDYLFATLACMSGIFAGDLLLFATGRTLGRGVLRVPIVRSVMTEERLRDASDWLTSRGFKVILLSRFMPGTRLPVYLAAGVLETSFASFARWFLASVAIWTPILVGLAAGWNTFASRIDFVTASLVAAALALIIRITTLDWETRRILLAKWRRLTRWEFWPVWLFYVPVVVWTVWLAVRHRSAACFTAVNPAIPGGGIVGESKSGILSGLKACEEFLPKALLLGGADPVVALSTFMDREGLRFPIVLKPDAGQRGSGVVVARSDDDAARYFATFTGPVLAQEYVPGVELGVFYVRHPDQPRGSIFSVTRKTFIDVVGDGRKTLAQLILGDDRAVCQAEIHLSRHRDRLDVVPLAGEHVALVELGTHCRGALFTNGDGLATPELIEAIDRISRSFEGFHFGRYDIRGSSIEEIQAGRFKVIELNGVTSEATAIYDPSNNLFSAWRTLFRQWSLAFEIGAANMKNGHRAATVREIIASIRSYYANASRHPAP